MEPSDFRKKLKDKRQKLRKAHIAGLNAVGLIVSTGVKRAVQKAPRGGKIYKIYTGSGNYRIHKASAPGEAPATDTGGLVRSITYVVDSNNDLVIIKCSRALAPYALVLEYGSANGKLLARPFMRPGVKDNKAVAIAAYNNIIKKELSDG